MKPLTKKIRSTLLIALIAISFSSCTHYYYGPNSSNIPMLQEKGEVKLMGAVTGADESTGFELQAAHAVTNHFGAMFNFYTAGGSDETTNSSTSTTTKERGTGTLGEIGAGYFTKIKGSENWIFETYGGVGKGAVTNRYSGSDNSKVNLTKLFIQPSIGVAFAEGIVEIAVSSRFSYVHFNVDKMSISPNNTTARSELQQIAVDPNHVFWEPALVTRSGFKNIKFHLQLTGSKPLKAIGFSTQSSSFSFGVAFTFAGKKNITDN